LLLDCDWAIRTKVAVGREGCHWHGPSEEESDELVGNLSRVSRLGFNTHNKDDVHNEHTCWGGLVIVTSREEERASCCLGADEVGLVGLVGLVGWHA
jgi:hypothetical protein